MKFVEILHLTPANWRNFIMADQKPFALQNKIALNVRA